MIVPQLLAKRLGYVENMLILSTAEERWVLCAAAPLIKLDMMRAEELAGLKNC